MFAIRSKVEGKIERHAILVPHRLALPFRLEF
jgi:hypothetical protein